MGRSSAWVREVTGRGTLKSPGAPSLPRVVERQFWDEIATGLLPREAAEAVGVAQAVGQRWFRHAGGMTPYSWPAASGRYLSFAEREEIAILNALGKGVREIAATLGRSPSTISRELRRNAATRGGKLDYRASVAQWKAEMYARRPKTAKLAANQRLREYVEERLSGQIRMPSGQIVAGPTERAWKGLNKPHRQDRRWVNAWSPEQISHRLKVDFPDDESMRISHEAIYQALFIEARGGLKRELILCLRTGRALRMPRARSKRAAWAHVSEDTLLSKRPAEAEDRAIPGHHEGDLIIGINRSAIGTVVERTTGYTTLVHLPREAGWREQPIAKNGPAFSGYGALSMNKALTQALASIPDDLKRSLTWDRGKEMSAHAQFTIDTGLKVYFADPRSPWQRGTNENTNGLLRQYFPKGTDLSRWSAADLTAVAHALNTRPRKRLGWRTPTEAWNEHLRSTEQQPVATTS
ncbi:IS30 family transposase [Myceligenerans salitolerans]|uniref:IS30 family transposase n=1 Tax=Myceligenerans salitolerans TaxID=1230528 RepID=A0ABS3IE53_9MICO|nr:IS30 family transposase [Myceligenerans salitolerans]MBO0611320.1 IS30 family transposase [Myceligenerans salitolerans]